VFLLGLMYATVFIGDIFELAKPVGGRSRIGCSRADPKRLGPRLDYPQRFGYWPAVIGYVALIWIELFSPSGATRKWRLS